MKPMSRALLLLAASSAVAFSWPGYEYDSTTGLFSSSFLYDWGFYGIIPSLSYKSFELTGPLLDFLTWDERCDDDGLYLLSMRGGLVSHPGPVIMDERGNLVWTSDRFGMVTDVQMQTYKGKEYLTFWSGTNGVSRTFGAGNFYMLDEGYEVFKIVQAVGDDLTGDMHEFHITADDTALFTIYHAIPMDFSSVGGRAEGWLTDSIFQEVDLETGALLFEWRASDHISLSAAWRLWLGMSDGPAPNQAVDFFHINSVDKDVAGNYLVSGRHTSAVYYISGKDGSIIWQLGGRDGSFRDVSDGERATDFQWQHHARFHDNDTISLFDNGKSDQTGPRPFSEQSRGLLVRLNLTDMTADLAQEYINPTKILTDAQGSVQMIPSSSSASGGSEEYDKALVAYGSDAGFAEFDATTGALLCNVRITPWISWERGWASSYRTFKTTPAKPWVGRPRYPPSVFLRPAERALYVSWNGATEVASWVLQGADWAGIKNDAWTTLDAEEKDGFEASFAVRDDMPEFVRVAALDRDGQLLKASAMVSRRVGNAPKNTLATVLTALGMTLGVLLVLGLIFRRRVVRGVSGGAKLVRKGVEKVWPRHWVRIGELQWRDWERERGRTRRRAGERDQELQPLYED